ncbi:hypothetical protein AX777_22105 [Sphingobium yanoikuyae]|uniref:Uncharacterized protein n=1 Tax=Sphingobium yanoikuyae TaxID=13690 RepID=A0A177JMX2_SPHYA|nr:hypothetical protein [Sphingobium yanoikuyae]OAH42144.1 hypothetical protein AX777_22105 [Sphingobium yanoikuyae]
MSLQFFLALLFNATLVLVCSYAIIRGGRPEKIGGLINLSASLLTTGLRLVDVEYYAPAHFAIFAIDIAVTGGFYWLGVTTIRFWPIWAAGFALANLFMSLLGGLLPSVPLFVYHTQLGIYAYLALGALALGTFRLPRHAEPHLRTGSRRSWIQHLKETS